MAVKPIQHIRRKYRLLCYVELYKLQRVKGMDPDAPVFGGPAQQQTKVVQRHLGMKPTGKWSTTLTRRLTAAGIPTFVAVSHKWDWRYALTRRGAAPVGITQHHSAGHGTVRDIHRLHQKAGVLSTKGAAGIGYHRIFDQDGTIHVGRPLSAIGAHCPGVNASHIGFCAIGNYEVQKTMPIRQRLAIRFERRHLRLDYPSIRRDNRHRDVLPTACPGRFFPFAKITGNGVRN